MNPRFSSLSLQKFTISKIHSILSTDIRKSIYFRHFLFMSYSLTALWLMPFDWSWFFPHCQSHLIFPFFIGSLTPLILLASAPLPFSQTFFAIHLMRDPLLLSHAFTRILIMISTRVGRKVEIRKKTRWMEKRKRDKSLGSQRGERTWKKWER